MVQETLNPKGLSAALGKDIHSAGVPPAHLAAGELFQKCGGPVLASVHNKLIQAAPRIVAQLGNRRFNRLLGKADRLVHIVDVQPVPLNKHRGERLLPEEGDHPLRVRRPEGGVEEQRLPLVKADLAVEGHVSVKGQAADGEPVNFQDMPPGSEKELDAPLPQQAEGRPGALGDASAGMGEQGAVYVKKDSLYHRFRAPPCPHRFPYSIAQRRG